MGRLKIASFNVKDNLRNYLMGGTRKKGQQSNAEVLSSLVKKENFDLLGTQEMTVRYANRLKKQLPDYRFFGGYRLGNGVLRYLPQNESNLIFSKYKVISDETIPLPFVPSFLRDFLLSLRRGALIPRIVTCLMVEISKENYLWVINTHLDYLIKEVQQRQLNVLRSFISALSAYYPIVLMGDFNMELNDSLFSSFVSFLAQHGMKRVPIQGTTWKNKMLDYLFVPQNWKIEQYGILKNKEISLLSDHFPIYVEVSYPSS